MAEAIHTEGTIIDIFQDSLAETYGTVGQYNAGEEKIIKDIGFYSSGMRLGDRNDLYYSAEDS